VDPGVSCLVDSFIFPSGAGEDYTEQLVLTILVFLTILDPFLVSFRLF